jgi:hypothetical protein
MWVDCPLQARQYLAASSHAVSSEYHAEELDGELVKSVMVSMVGRRSF